MPEPTPTPDAAKPSVFLANVGANSSHRFLSPLFDDGSFEFITIPEEPLAAGPHSVRYRDLRSHYDSSESLARWVPDRLLDMATHFDPEFGTNTYGDNCEWSPRAFGLKEVRTGDLIFFLVRLALWTGGRFTGETGFFLIGFIEVESVFRAPADPTEAASPPRYAGNAHVRRAMNDSRSTGTGSGCLPAQPVRQDFPAPCPWIVLSPIAYCALPPASRTPGRRTAPNFR